MNVNVDDVVAMVEADELGGFCTECGAETYGVEPDARRYPCDECGARAVYGAQELLIMLVA